MRSAGEVKQEGRAESSRGVESSQEVVAKGATQMAMAGNEDEEEKRWKGQLTADWTDRGYMYLV